MPATPLSCSFLTLQPRFNSYVKPIFRSLSFQLPSSTLPFNANFSSIRLRSSLSRAAETDSPTGGRSGALTPGPTVTGDVQKIDVNPPKGTRDFPPEDMRLRNWLFNHFKEGQVSRLYGFEEVDYPVLESEALFTRKAGEEIKDQAKIYGNTVKPIIRCLLFFESLLFFERINEWLYCFEDRGNRRVALRPELTPSLARLVIQKGKSVSLPIKWFTVGQCWRYERMTRGRRREHYQWNMDIIGVPGVMAEAELISSIVTLFKRIGITESDVGFKVSSRKLPEQLLVMSMPKACSQLATANTCAPKCNFSFVSESYPLSLDQSTKARQQSMFDNVAQVIALFSIEDVTTFIVDHDDFLHFKVAYQPTYPIDPPNLSLGKNWKTFGHLAGATSIFSSMFDSLAMRRVQELIFSGRTFNTPFVVESLWKMSYILLESSFSLRPFTLMHEACFFVGKQSLPTALVLTFNLIHMVLQEIEKIPIDEIKKELKAVGLSQEAVQKLLDVLSVKSLTELEERLGCSGEAVADLKQLFSLAEKNGFSKWLQFDASVVRVGLIDSMTTALKVHSDILGACVCKGSPSKIRQGFDREGKLRAICGGGRYDHLFSTFGADDIAACGFGFGDAVIVELLGLPTSKLLKEKGMFPELNLHIDNIVCALDEDLQGCAAMVANILREKGQSVELVLESKPLKWVFKRASRVNAERLVLVGNSEWQRGVVGVKILSTAEQYEVKLDDLK
ncbi:unnamed protein product [Sphenostylis stenocarpa]|uniref:histidine--tRNA ligase n=1 Tax=Sphenostylis stenocarpa TaxID=92480 RepID=A0AA86S448_9FABA|nr:unnamed protein product [Sphenostylis stenocarpa]